MTKSFIRGVLGIILPPIVAWLASGYGNPLVTWGILVAGYLVSAFIFRATLLMIISTRVYSSNKEKGLKLFDITYKTGKLSPSYQLIYSYVLIRNGKLDEAENVMNKALVLGKQILREDEVKASDFNRALITWKRGDLASAIVQLEELYENGYITSAMFDSLSSFYLLNKEYDKAAQVAKEGMDYSRVDLVSRDNLGQAYIELGKTEEAREIYNELIPQSPSFLEAYYNYATILEKQGELEEAKKYYGIALTIEEKFLSIINHEQVCEALDRVNDLLA